MKFIFDLDGTICFKGQPVSKNILDYLEHLQSLGHLVGFASARPCRDMLPVLDERFRHNLLIGANGAMTYYQGELTHINYIPMKLASEILAILEEFKASYLIDDQWDYAYNFEDSHPFLENIDALNISKRVTTSDLKYIVKILVLSCDRFEELSRRLRELKVTIHYHSSEGILDITNKDTSKMEALRRFGIGQGEFTCFGNDMNDISMFKEAHYSVAIGSFAGLTDIAKHCIHIDDNIEKCIIEELQKISRPVIER